MIIREFGIDMIMHRRTNFKTGGSLQILTRENLRSVITEGNQLDNEIQNMTAQASNASGNFRQYLEIRKF